MRKRDLRLRRNGDIVVVDAISSFVKDKVVVAAQRDIVVVAAVFRCRGVAVERATGRLAAVGCGSTCTVDLVVAVFGCDGQSQQEAVVCATWRWLGYGGGSFSGCGVMVAMTRAT